MCLIILDLLYIFGFVEATEVKEPELTCSLSCKQCMKSLPKNWHSMDNRVINMQDSFSPSNKWLGGWISDFSNIVCVPEFSSVCPLGNVASAVTAAGWVCFFMCHTGPKAPEICFGPYPRSHFYVLRMTSWCSFTSLWREVFGDGFCTFFNRKETHALTDLWAFGPHCGLVILCAK